MSLLTIARPYAKAAFDFAVEKKAVARWQSMLTFSAKVSDNEQMAKLLSGVIAPKKLANAFIVVCGNQLDVFGQNLIRVMAEYGRLAVLPNVLEEFIYLRAVQESTAEVEVISASPLNKKQIVQITAAIGQRLSRKVKLNCRIDKSIVAGVVIRVDDMVIDGSVRCRLERLAEVLPS